MFLVRSLPKRVACWRAAAIVQEMSRNVMTTTTMTTTPTTTMRTTTMTTTTLTTVTTVTPKTTEHQDGIQLLYYQCPHKALTVILRVLL